MEGAFGDVKATERAGTFVYLPGAGGGIPDLTLLKAGPEDGSRFEAIEYPGWQRYVAEDFDSEALIEELAARIAAKAPEGPIRIIGLSCGGHLAYASALRLQALGREIAGFCAIDSFMEDTAAPTAGWKQRALAEALQLLRERRMGEFVEFARSRFWRALMRLSEGWLPGLLRRFSGSKGAPAMDPILENEMSMRFLLRIAVPWVAELDRDPKALAAPAVLIRTEANGRFDDAWRRRCPNIQIHGTTGGHHQLFDSPNVEILRRAFVEGTRAWR